MHFNRWPVRTMLERFMDMVSPEPNSGCWLWTGAVSPGGYGRFQTGERVVEAHRWCYEFHKGPIPEGLLGCHKCDVPGCVNYEHIFIGTPKENTQDNRRKDRFLNNKLTPDQVREIRAASGTLKEIGERYGVRLNTIHCIRAGKTWQHVT